MKKTSNILLVVSILFMASCATKVKTKKYADINTNNFKTFACYASATSFNAEEFKTKSKQPIEESLISLINTKMSEKGFSVNDKEPDMVIFLTNSNDINSGKGDRDANSVTNRDGASAQGPNNASIVTQGYKRYSSAQDEIDRVPINNGALVVEIFSRETKELLWVGIARDFKSHITDQTLMSRMINGVFQDFPN